MEYNQHKMSQVGIVKLSVSPQTNTKSLPVLSGQSQGRENRVSQFRYASGETTCHFEHEHGIYMSLVPRPVRFLHIKELEVCKRVMTMLIEW